MKWVIIVGLIGAAIIFVLLWSVASTIANADDSKVVIRDNSGLFIGSTRSTNTGRVIVRDQFGIVKGSIRKDGTITNPYGKVLGRVDNKDD